MSLLTTYTIHQAHLEDMSFFLSEAQLQKIFKTARMYNQLPPSQPMEKVYGLTAFELG